MAGLVLPGLSPGHRIRGHPQALQFVVERFVIILCESGAFVALAV